MGKVIKKQLNGMSWWMKTSLVLLLTLATSLFMYEGWYTPKQVQAAVAVSTNWAILGSSTTTIATLPAMTLAKPATTNRLLVVSFIGDYGTAITTFAPTITYGGQTLTEIVSTDTSSRQKVWIGYLNDAGITAASSTSFAVSGVAPDAGCALSAAIYNGVNQSTPITGSRSVSSDTATTTPTSATIPVTAGGWAIYSLMTNSSTAVNASVPAGYTEHFDTANGTLYMFTMGSGTMGTTGTTNPLPVWTSVRYAFLTASLEPAPVAAGGTLAVSTTTQTVAEAVGNATVSVTRTGGTTGAVTVDYATGNGTAIAGQDYTSTTGTLSWAAGDATPKTITVPIINDTFDDTANETFTVTLTNATNGATLGTAVQTVTITDDDATPTIAFSSTTSTGNNTTTPATFNVALSAVSGLSTSVNYVTTALTAVAGTDYTTTSGTLTIPALSPSGTISVPILSGGTGGTFRVTISVPVNAALGANTIHTYTITSQLPSSFTNCNGCHGYTTTFGDGTARNTPPGQFQGSHNQHVVGSSMACSACHTAPATITSADYNHANGTVTMASPISGGTYVKGSFTAANSFAPSTCNTTNCHGAASPTWGTSTTQSTCTKCHGVNNTTPAAYTADTETAAPGYLTTGRDTGGATAAADAEVGAHDTHLRGLNTISSPIACTECHANVNTTNATFTGHMDGAGSLNFGTLATSGSGTAPGYVSGTGTCSNTYCHYGRSASYAPPATTNGNVVWFNTAYMTGVDTPAADCGKCHASPPLTTGSHAGVTLISECNGCHSHVNTSGVFTDSSLHVNGIVEASGSCIDCHATAKASPIAQALDATVTTRAAVVGEFTNTWSHKRSFTGTPKVTDADCIVCHTEGDKTTGSTTAAHKDGYVNLRDPDTGLNIKNVTFGGTNAGSYTEGATNVQFVRFKRDFSKRLEKDANFLTIAAVQQNHCLKCHDTAGAASVEARVPTTGTALRPFGVAITGHVAPLDSNGSGNVVDVNKSFLTTNSSYHPVRGKGNNWFTHYSSAGATGGNMIAPWRGPFSTRGASVNVTSWGYLISCWDCHAPAGTTYASGVVTRSVTAHGATATLRGGIRAAGTTAATNLCLNCHRVSYATTSSAHGANTAYTSGSGNMGTATFNNCSYCHAFSAAGATQGTTAGSTSTLRPLRGEDAHGFNDRTAGTVGSKWTTANVRPYAFIRNSLSILVPLSTTASGETISGTAAICTGTGGTCNNNMSGDVYGGGTY